MTAHTPAGREKPGAGCPDPKTGGGQPGTRAHKEDTTVKDKTEKPRAVVVDVLPLTAAGNGLNLWGHVTPHALADVLGPGYFDACQAACGGGLYRHDRIVCTASAETDSPEHATLVVVDAGRARGVRVEILKEAGRARKGQ